jgi:CDP-4-dehydro-6-deoxyglucose reductase
MVHPSFDARVVSARALSPNVREVTFARADGASFEFEPGQWVSLLLPGEGGEIRRAYSIASAPRRDASFEIAVTRVDAGVGSARLHALGPGDIVRVIGPQGFFTRPMRGGAPALFVGTGTGVAPLRSMIHAALAAEDPALVWLLFGAREEADLLYRDELAELAERSPQLRVEETLSRGSEDWTGRRGYVQARALFRKEVGLGRELVHTERYD